MQPTLGYLALIVLFFSLVFGGCFLNYKVNEARYPNAPTWTNWMAK